MKLDLAGRVKNTHLPKGNALLPMFEAVVNSFQSIEERPADGKLPYIDVFVHHQATLPGIGMKGEVIAFTITDNGIGFTDENQDSFFTSDTRYKVNRGGKGVGRFSWLKAFERAEITSYFRAEGQIWKRDFSFTTDMGDPEVGPVVADVTDLKTTVHLAGMRSTYSEHCPRSIEVIGRRLAEHCLPFFLDPVCPAVTIRDEDQGLDLRQYFHDTFTQNATLHGFQVGNESFKMRGLRIYNPQETQHRLIYAANAREVFPEKLVNHLPNLQKSLNDEHGHFVYLGFIEGDYLDQHVNSERTNFLFPTDEEDEPLADEITLGSIRSAALPLISRDLAPFLEELNKQKLEAITKYINTEAPEYLFLRKHLPEFIDRIPPGTKGFKLEMALHEELYKKRRDLKQDTKKLMEETGQESLTPEDYEAKMNAFLEKANELGKSSLAQYVTHRKVILEFLEKSLRINPATGKYPLEEVIHRIIYPMRTTSEDVPYEQQNLWIIDERLSFHRYLSSDMPLDSVEVLSNSARSRPDLLIFDRALSFAEDEGSLGSVVIIEFKKPDRRDFGNEDPVDQVYRLIRQIKTGHFKDKDGREIKIKSPQIPAYAYVICDTVKEVDTIAENKSFIRTPDGNGWYGYNPTLSTYVEIISYQKLLDDAKKRNRVLFDKLHLPISTQ